MPIVTPLHHYYREAHLEHVVAEMRKRGAPRIRAHFDGFAWYCFDGTHRLRAALRLGLAPVMLPRKWPRSRKALERARFAALQRGHVFEKVEVSG